MIKFDKVTKRFANGTFALQRISFEIKKGEFLSIVGSSGSGKTTLLRLLRREILPSRGKVFFKDRDIQKFSEADIVGLRRKISIIFQDYKLLEERTIFENVAIALEVMSVGVQEIEKRVEEALKEMGVWEKKDFFPAQLSGGEIQKTAVARTIISAPEVILADEPTADLDPATTWEVIGFLDKLNKKDKTTIILATHDFDIVDTLRRRVITLDKGQMISDVERGGYDSA